MTETRMPSPAVVELCRLHRDMVRAERDRIAAAAMTTDSIDPADGWMLDISRSVYVRPTPAAPVEAPHE